MGDSDVSRNDRRRRFAALLGLLVVGVIVIAVLAPTTSAHARSRPLTRPGPDGVTSLAVIAQNRLRGTSGWRISPRVSPIAIQGFANLTYAAQGQRVRLYVTTRQPTFRVVAYRMGWYHGAGARRVWTSALQRGHQQPACPVTRDTNMVSCANWRVSLTMNVTTSFFPGDYLLKLVAGPRAASYVPLTVWSPRSRATYVVMNRSFVEQGWNAYGGYSFYQGVGHCILDNYTYPPCNRARVVSFDRPYNTGYGSSDFLTNEFPLVQLAEREGLDVTYITDVTLSEHPNLLSHHRVLLSLDHDETWTFAERRAVVNAVAHGVNVVYFGAAAMVRHIRLEPSALGPDRQEVDYRNAAEDPLHVAANPMQVTGNTWESPPTNWPPLSQIGVQYSGYLTPGVTAPMVITSPSSWVFRGTGLRKGSKIPGVIASDFDHVIASSLTPPNLEILAHSPIPASQATVSGGTWGGVSYSDMVYFTNPKSRAGVIDTGNNVWIGDLRACPPSTTPCAGALLTTMTNNILRLFGRGPAGFSLPSVSNLSRVTPAGS